MAGRQKVTDRVAPAWLSNQDVSWVQAGPTSPKRQRLVGTNGLRGFSVFLRPTARRGVELWSMVQPTEAA